MRNAGISDVSHPTSLHYRAARRNRIEQAQEPHNARTALSTKSTQIPQTSRGRTVAVTQRRGTPDVPWEGKTVRTAIWKEPVDGPRMVRRINIDGDDQADRAAHGGEHRAVFVYQIESYRYWEQQLQRDDFVYGQFGENFTVEGLADDRGLHRRPLPDRRCDLRGHAAARDLLSRRHPVGRAPDAVAARRPSQAGFYFRVIQEGEVQAGDEIRRAADGTRGADRRRCRRAAVPPEPLTAYAGAGAADPGAEQGLAGLVPRAARAGRAACRRSSGDRLGGLRAADRHRGATREQHDHVLRPAPTPARTRRLERRRPIPHASAATRRARPRVRCAHATRCRRSRPTTDTGSASSSSRAAWAAGSCNEHVKPGDTIDAAAPRGDFVLRDNDDPVALISAGVGATPVLAMLRTLAKRHDARQVWWIHGARNGAGARLQAGGRRTARRTAQRPSDHRLQPSRPRRRARRHLRPGGPDHDRDDRSSADPGDRRLTTSAAPPGSCTSCPRGSRRGGIPPERISMEIFGTVEANTPGVARGPARSPSTRGTVPGKGPSSRSAAATSRSRGTRATRACSSSPRRATCPSASAAEPASATPARAASSTER